MRRVLFCLALSLSLLILASAGSRAATVTIAEEHISINMASGWTYERNYTSGGLIYDLYMEGPSGTGLMPPIGLLDGSYWPGIVDDDMLYAEMEDELESTEDEPDFTGVTIVLAPSNTTVDDHEANDCTIRMNVSGLEVRSRLVIIGDPDWDRAWKVMFMDEESDWSANSAAMNTMIESISIEEKEDGGLSSAILVGIVVVVIVAVIVIGVFMMRRKKQPQMYPAPLQPPAPPPNP